MSQPNLKLGESFTLELMWEDTTPILSLVHTKSTSSKAKEQESVSTEPRIRDSSSPNQNQFVTLALTHEDVKTCKLELTVLRILKNLGLVKLVRMVNKHFFKPLLHGFHTYLTIPVAFFLKYIEGINEQRMVKLRSDVSKVTWEVKVEDDGQKLTDGWREFALAHDLRIGDILVFRQEKDMTFHVTILGPSCCEIQYDSCLVDNENNLKKSQRKKNTRRGEDSSSLDHSCFVANVAPSSLRYDTLYFPKSFVRENRIDTRRGEILLMDEKGKSWTLALKRKKTCGSIYITRGWRSFCGANGLKVGDSFTFKMIQRGGTLVLRLLTTESEEEEEEDESSEDDEVGSLSTERDSDEGSSLNKIQRKKKNPKAETESSSLDASSFVANVTSATIHYDILNLPRPFARANGLDKRCGEINLMNQKGKSWTLLLTRKNSCGTVYITRGWRKFCRANGLRAGGFYTFKLIERRGTLALCLSEEKEDESSEDDEIKSLSAEQEIGVESNQGKKRLRKRKSMWEASSSASQNRFVTLKLTSLNLKKYVMFLPVGFTRFHGINEETRMSMLDKHGVKWSTKPRSEKTSDRIRLTGGWKEFFKANCIETGESALLELIWEGYKSCVLKFCSKVKQETK